IFPAVLGGRVGIEAQQYLQSKTCWINRRPLCSNARLKLDMHMARARRFLPEDVTDEQAVIGALWLFGQCSIFVRNAEQLAKAPFRLELDERFVDRLADMIAGWAANGLGRLPSKGRP